MEFRLDVKGDVWHCNSRCPKWPLNSSNILSIEELPSGFKFCPSCQALTRVIPVKPSVIQLGPPVIHLGPPQASSVQIRQIV